jgi:hypothetical protein
MTTTAIDTQRVASGGPEPAGAMTVDDGGQDPGPIFVVGPDRSGTTLMQALLGSHPRIAMPPKASNMWTYFYDRYGDLSVPANLERCLAAILAYRHAAVPSGRRPDPGRVLVSERPRAPFAVIHAQYARRLGKPLDR